MYKILFSAIIFIGVLTIEVNAQINFKIGYNYTYAPFSVNNEVLAQYNASISRIEQSFKPLHSFHGIHLGFRYKAAPMAIEFSWEHGTKDLQAIGYITNDEVFTKKLYYSTNQYSLGLENYFGAFGYGATIGKQKFKIKTDISNTDVKRGIVNQSEYVSKFYLIYTIHEGNAISLVVKPYVQIPWQGYDIQALQTELLPSSTDIVPKEDSFQYGLTLLFYNGRQ